MIEPSIGCFLVFLKIKIRNFDIFIIRCRREDSNLRPTGYESVALATKATTAIFLNLFLFFKFCKHFFKFIFGLTLYQTNISSIVFKKSLDFWADEFAFFKLLKRKDC